MFNEWTDWGTSRIFLLWLPMAANNLFTPNNCQVGKLFRHSPFHNLYSLWSYYANSLVLLWFGRAFKLERLPIATKDANKDFGFRKRKREWKLTPTTPEVSKLSSSLWRTSTLHHLLPLWLKKRLKMNDDCTHFHSRRSSPLQSASKVCNEVISEPIN